MTYDPAWRHAPECSIPFRTKPEDARLDSPLVKLPTCKRIVTALPLADGTAPMLGPAFLRASLARCDVRKALAQFGLVPITPAVYRELAAIGWWVPPHFLVFDKYDQAHMTSLGYSMEQNRLVWASLREKHGLGPADIDRLTRPVVWAKTHAANPQTGEVDRMVGFDEHDDGRADLIQDGDGPNHAAQPDVHDYGTVVVGMVPEGNERIAA